MQDSEPRVVDVTAELIGERREEWHDGYEAGIRAGVRRTLESHALAEIALELKLLRATAKSLGWQADHWRRLFLEAVDVIGSPKK